MPSWSTPPTFTAGNTLTGAQLTTYLKDNTQYLYDLFNNAWSSYTPTITQSGTVAKTMSYGKYAQFGKFVIATVDMAITGSGTSGNVITCTLPVNRAYTTTAYNIGTFYAVDQSTASIFRGLVRTVAGAQTINFLDVTGGVTIGNGGGAYTFGLANTDALQFTIQYEAA